MITCTATMKIKGTETLSTFLHLTVAVAATGGVIISVHLNAWCRDIKRLLRLLSKSILSNGLESLFYVDGLLGARLKVWDFILGLAPSLGSLGGHGSVIQINFVSQHNKREVVRVSGTGLNEELVPPAVE